MFLSFLRHVSTASSYDRPEAARRPSPSPARPRLGATLLLVMLSPWALEAAPLAAAPIVPAPLTTSPELGASAEEQTLEEIERVGTAMLAWALDNITRRTPDGTATFAVTFDVTDVPIITAMDLEAILVPTYLSTLPSVDAWGQPYEYRLDTVDPLIVPFSAIRSAGADGVYEGSVYTPGFTADADGDLVFFSGSVIRRPMPSAAEAPLYTLEVLEQIVAGVASWRTDQVGPLRAPAQDDSEVAVAGCDGYSVDASAVPSISFAALEALLVPNYLLFLPQVDGWGHAFDFGLDTDILASSDWFLARSPGSDDVFEGPVYAAGFTTAQSQDVVAHESYLVRRPARPGAEQTETLADTARIGVAIFNWIIDNAFRTGEGVAGAVDVDTLAAITHAELEALLVPFYVPCLPKRDFWGHDYDFWLDTENIFASPLTGIRSRGSGGLAEGTVYVPGTFPADDTERDLLWVDGVHLRIPDPTLLFLDGFESGDVGAWSLTVP